MREVEPCLERPPFPQNRSVREGYLPPVITKVLLWLGLTFLAGSIFYAMLRSAKAERDVWRADRKQRTELCEAQGGIPRYQVRGRSYDGCDFPPDKR